MKEQNKTNPDPVKPNLKHDTMEYSAATDGDDILDADTETKDEVEEEQISAEELELLGEDDIDDQASALNTAETDSLADEDNFLNEPETKEVFEEEEDDEDESKNIRR